MAGSPPVAVGVDVGGTKLLAGLVAADGAVLTRARAQTPAGDGDAVVALVAKVVERLLTEAGGPLPVGVGIAGVLDADGVLCFAPNLRLADYPLLPRLGAALPGLMLVENDANVAGWGEYMAGAARATSGTVVVLTIGTGIGGGLVVDGRLHRGANGMGGELGHLVVAEGGPRCGCGNNGCLEALASGTAIGRTAAELLATGQAPPGTVLRDADVLSGKTVTLAAQAGDEFARDVLSWCGFWLGVGIASLVNVLDPALVVVGGGAMQAGELLLEPARRSYAERVVGRGHRPFADVVPAALGDDAGLVGAALLAAG